MAMEHEIYRSRQRIALWGSALICLALTGLQLGFYLGGYEFESDLYVPGSLPTITAIAWIAAAAIVCILALRLPGKAVCKDLTVSPSPFTDYTALLTMASLVSAVALPLLWRNSGDPLGDLLSSADIADNTARTMLILSLVMAVPAALHFLLQFTYRKTHPLGVSAVLLWTGFSALRVYFDMRYLLMSPRRVLHLVALVSVLLYLVGELRLVRGIATPRFYTVTAVPALVFAGCDAITNLILTVMGWVTPGSEICTYFVLFSMALYIAARLNAMSRPPKAPAAPAVTAVEDVPADENSPDTPIEESPEEGTPDRESPDIEESPSEKSPDETEESPE